MNKISLTSKGQVTLPAEYRKSLNLKKGDRLDVYFNERLGSLTLKKPATIEELSARISSYVKNAPKPVLNVGQYYQENKDKDIR
ncbi:AbrB family transcriptional regulator [Candidatus Saccharibacteria bacterium CG10_big_fil_rev_8_21_14_0_10_47_8]|nr:MAG: AbrB family transcriptional regulator [Candidatus Saccharibacteria bacterium CG10_big_fil_rev_8_21_14_0_10_47_8]